MYVTRVPNRSSPPAILLRESYREGGRVKTRTLANLSNWTGAKVEALKRVLRGERLLVPADRFEIERALPHGHVAAAPGAARQAGPGADRRPGDRAGSEAFDGAAAERGHGFAFAGGGAGAGRSGRG